MTRMTEKKRQRRGRAESLAPAVQAVATASGKVPLSGVLAEMRSPGLGFERVEHVPGSTYRESSTVIITPTRGVYKTVDPASGKEVEVEGLIDRRVVSAWQGLIRPMNQKSAWFFTSGHEVGRAYDAVVKQVLDHPQLRDWQYVLTLEDDNLPPPDALLRLLETIEWGKYDAVSGLYFTKGDVNMPMAYGDPEEYKRTGVMDFKPRDVRAALAMGQIMPVCGIACGCALWRMSLFRELPPPWYVTMNDIVPGKGVVGMTQDLRFSEQLVRAGKRLAVDLRIKVGHLDVASGLIF